MGSGTQRAAPRGHIRTSPCPSTDAQRAAAGKSGAEKPSPSSCRHLTSEDGREAQLMELSPAMGWGAGHAPARGSVPALRGHRSPVLHQDAPHSGRSGTRSGSSWRLPCCEASTLQRGAGKSPSASPRPCPEPFLMFLRFFPASPSQGRGSPSPGGSSAAVAEHGGCRSQRPPAARRCRAGRFFEEALGSYLKQNPQRPELAPGHPGRKPREREFSCS